MSRLALNRVHPAPVRLLRFARNDIFGTCLCEEPAGDVAIYPRT